MRSFWMSNWISNDVKLVFNPLLVFQSRAFHPSNRPSSLEILSPILSPLLMSIFSFSAFSCGLETFSSPVRVFSTKSLELFEKNFEKYFLFKNLRFFFEKFLIEFKYILLSERSKMEFDLDSSSSQVTPKQLAALRSWIDTFPFMNEEQGFTDCPVK